MGYRYSFRNLFIKMMDRNMSQAELGALAGISSASVSRLKQGKAINLDSIMKVCDVMDCELQDIMEIIKEDEK